MRWISALLLALLTISTTAALSNSITPEELKVKVAGRNLILRAPPPTIGNGKVFVLGDSGSSLIALTTKGEKLWSYELGARVSSPPLVIPNASYGYARKESWVIVATNSFELWAFETVHGGLRIERLRLPSAPSGASLYYLRDGRTILVPLASSIQAVDIRSKSISWSIDLGFKPMVVKYINSMALVIGKQKVAYLDISTREVVWSVDLKEEIASYGSDGRQLAILLDNGTMISINVANGFISGSRDLGAILGYDIPGGEFPVIDNIAAVTGSRGVMYFIDVLTLKDALRPMRTWAEPSRQPLAIGKALIYISKDGTLRVYHFPKRFLLSKFKVSEIPYSEISLAKSQESYTNIMAYVGKSGYLHIIKLPDYWIRTKEVEKRENGYLVEGYVCSTAVNGSKNRIKLYSISPQGEILGEKFIGILGPGECGAGFSTLVKGRGAIGLVVGNDRLLPNVPIGMTRAEWISYKPGKNVTTTTASVTQTKTQTTSKPLTRPIFMAIAPEQVKVGDNFEIKISGINGWDTTELTFYVSGPTIEKNETSVKVSKGSSFELSLMSKALRPGKGDITVKVVHGDRTLNETRVPISVSIGKIIQGIDVPSSAKVNKSINIKVMIVNRYEDGASLGLRITLDGQTKNISVGPMAAGESVSPSISITPKSAGNFKLKLQVIAPNGKIIDELSSFISVASPSVSITAAKPQKFPFSIEYIIAVIAIIMVISALAVVLIRPKREKEEIPPRKTKISEAKERKAVPAPAKKPPQVEELAPQAPLRKEEKPEEKIVTPPEIEEELEIPTVPSKLPTKEEKEEEIPKIPPEIRERLERDMNLTKRRLEEIKRAISRLEEIVGFEVSPYRLIDAEKSLISAEMKLKEGNVKEAEGLLRSIDESLDTLEAEVSEAEKSLVENWSAVENRIDIMLRVWGKAPANMLTMVPVGFRIAALERFRRLHPDRKLELRGDELVVPGE